MPEMPTKTTGWKPLIYWTERSCLQPNLSCEGKFCGFKNFCGSVVKVKALLSHQEPYLQIGNAEGGQVMISYVLTVGYKLHICCHFQASTQKYRQCRYEVIGSQTTTPWKFQNHVVLILCSPSRTKMLTLTLFMKLMCSKIKLVNC